MANANRNNVWSERSNFRVRASNEVIDLTGHDEDDSDVADPEIVSLGHWEFRKYRQDDRRIGNPAVPQQPLPFTLSHGSLAPDAVPRGKSPTLAHSFSQFQATFNDPQQAPTQRVTSSDYGFNIRGSSQASLAAATRVEARDIEKGKSREPQVAATNGQQYHRILPRNDLVDRSTTPSTNDSRQWRVYTPLVSGNTLPNAGTSSKRLLNGDVKTPSVKGIISKPQDSHDALRRLQAKTNLPADVVRFLEILNRSVTAAGRPNRSAAKEQLGFLGDKFFGKNGDLKASAPLWDYTLEQLGLSEETWRHLIRKDKAAVFPGPGARAQLGRPSKKQDDIPPLDIRRYKPSQSQNFVRHHVSQDGSTASISEYTPLATIAQDHRVPVNVRQTTLNLPSGATDQTRLLYQKVKAAFPGDNGYAKLVSWTPIEDQLLIHLKEDLSLPWETIGWYFAHRSDSWHTAQSRYSQKLNRRHESNQAPLVLTQADFEKVVESSSEDSDNPPVEQRRKSDRLTRANAKVNYNPRDYYKTIGIDTQKRESSEESIIEPAQSEARNGSISPQGRARSGLRPLLWSGLENITSSTDKHIPVPSSNPALVSILQYERDLAALSGGLKRLSRRPGTDLIAKPKVSLGLPRRSKTLKRRSVEIYRPYLSSNVRSFLQDNLSVDEQEGIRALEWDGTLLHVDFDNAEIENLEECVFTKWGFDLRTGVTSVEASTSERLGFLIRNALEVTDNTIRGHELASQLARYVTASNGLINRTEDSIVQFLRSAASQHDEASNLSAKDRHDRKQAKPSLKRLEVRSQETSVHQGVRSRELGSRTTGRMLPSSMIHSAVLNSMGPLMSFTGTSSDVNAVAWASDGITFAVGSYGVADSHSMQYNRPNNLLLGNVRSKVLRELPYHATARPRLDEGPNSSHEMFTSQDPLLYQTVSAVGFLELERGSVLISTGYDNTIQVHDLREDGGTFGFRDKVPIDLLATNDVHGLFAVGAKHTQRGIRVLKADLDVDDTNSLRKYSLFSPRAAGSEQEIHPSALKWGNLCYGQAKYLLGGFSSATKEFGEGETCLWDIESESLTATARGNRTVFDVAWSPATFGRFAVASGKTSNVNKGIQSVVQIYDSRLLGRNIHVDGHRRFELECPALDINDLIFNPSDENLLSVGCTDACIYMWDLRNPDRILHRLAHGPPVIELREELTQEECDTGVRFMSWNATRRTLVSGSSDGIVARWDPYLAPQDAYIGNVTQLKSGVMSGAYSKDFSSLLLGEVNGSVNVLSVGRDAWETPEVFDLEPASGDVMASIYRNLRMEKSDSTQQDNTTPGKELLQSGQIKIVPFGNLPIRQAIQGPNYNGPYDSSPDAPRLREEASKMQSKFAPTAQSCHLDHEPDQFFTEEEKGDNAASLSRIPENYRFKSDEEVEKTLVGFACQSCGKLGSMLFIQADSLGNIMSCEYCKKAWRSDLLGYTPLDVVTGQPLPQSKRNAPRDADVAMIDAKEAEMKERELDIESLQNLEDYIHSFWEDRPASPL